LRVYNYMGIGLVITGLVAYGLHLYAAQNLALAKAIYTTPGRYILMFAPLVFVFVFAASIHKLSVAAAQLMFWVYAALVGASLSIIFLLYTGSSIAQVFFITAATFGTMSLYGYTTKKDLSGWGSFLIMGVIGLFIASVVNLFMQSPGLSWAISFIGVIVFTGLTAYDTQTIKESYYAGDSEVVAGRKAIIGALELYMDFVNLFIMLLRMLGNRE
jgi:uncharacterized protein